MSNATDTSPIVYLWARCRRSGHGRSIWGMWLSALLAMGGCAARSPGQGHRDIEEGPCRTDADCPSEHRCAHERAHLWRRDKITRDLVTFRCEPEAEYCQRQRLDFEQRAENSRTRHCDADSECAAICGPRWGCPDENVVVHAYGSRGLQQIANRVLDACGTFFVLDPAAGYSEIEARCISNTCGELRTSVAPYEDSP